MLEPSHASFTDLHKPACAVMALVTNVNGKNYMLNKQGESRDFMQFPVETDSLLISSQATKHELPRKTAFIGFKFYSWYDVIPVTRFEKAMRNHADRYMPQLRVLVAF